MNSKKLMSVFLTVALCFLATQAHSIDFGKITKKLKPGAQGGGNAASYFSSIDDVNKQLSAMNCRFVDKTTTNELTCDIKGFFTKVVQWAWTQKLPNDKGFHFRFTPQQPTANSQAYQRFLGVKSIFEDVRHGNGTVPNKHRNSAGDIFHFDMKANSGVQGDLGKVDMKLVIGRS